MKRLMTDGLSAQLSSVAANLGGSYIFSGPKGTGKFSAAHQLGLAHSGDKASVTVIKPEPKSIGIDVIKELQQSLQLKLAPGEQHWVIIDDAQTLTLEAQNSFLKTLEEPPAATTIVLVTNSIDELLPTIRSRCQNICFGLAVKALISSYLQTAYKIKPAEAEAISALARGRIAVAVCLASDKDYYAQLKGERELAVKFVRGNHYQRLVLGKEALDAKAMPTLVEAVLQLLLPLWRQSIASGKANARSLNKLVQQVLQLQEYLRANGNPKFALDQLSLELPA